MNWPTSCLEFDCAFGSRLMETISEISAKRVIEVRTFSPTNQRVRKINCINEQKLGIVLI